MAFKIAGSMAIQEGARKANPVLLEPVMAVEVVTPEDFLGDVIGDLSRRRGKVQGQEQRGNALAVQAFVPLGEMFGYATELRSIDPGPGDLHDAVRALRGGPRRTSPRRSSSTALGTRWVQLIGPTADGALNLAIFPRFARRQDKAACQAVAHRLKQLDQTEHDFER